MEMTVEQQKVLALAKARARAAGALPEEEGEEETAAAAEGEGEDSSTIGNIAGGLAQSGMGIVSNLMRPFEAAFGDSSPTLSDLVAVEKKTPHEKRMERVKRRFEAKGYDTDSPAFQGAKVAGDVAITAPVGGALAAGVKYVPGLSKALPGIENALRTYGFSGKAPAAATTVGKRAADLGVRTVGGSTSGAATAAAINLDDADTGAVVGGILPPVVSGLGKAVKAIRPALHGFDETFLPGGTRRSAGRIASTVAGDKADEITTLLRKGAAGETAGQATTDAGSAEFAALQAFAKSKLPSQYEAVAEGQEAARRALLASVTPDEAAARAARGKITDPMRETALKAANTAGEVIRKLNPQIQQKTLSQADAVNSAGKMYGWGVQQKQILEKMLAKTPGWVSPATVNRFTTNINNAMDASRELVGLGRQRTAERAHLEYKLGSLEAHGLRPLDTTAVMNKIEDQLTKPGLRMSDDVQSVLTALREKFDVAYLSGNDAHDIYQIRKDGINQIVKQKLAGADPKTQNKLAAMVTAQLRPVLDEAIEAAGGTGWTKYLKQYGEMSRKIDQAKLLKRMDSVLEQPGGGERVQPFLNQLGRGEGVLLKRSTGMPRYGEGDLFKVLNRPQGAAVREVERQLKGGLKEASLAKAGMPELLGILRMYESPTLLPGLIDARITIANAVLRKVTGSGGRGVDKDLAMLMLPENKALLADVLERAKPSQLAAMRRGKVGKRLLQMAPVLAAQEGEE